MYLKDLCIVLADLAYRLFVYLRKLLDRLLLCTLELIYFRLSVLDMPASDLHLLPFEQLCLTYRNG